MLAAPLALCFALTACQQSPGAARAAPETGRSIGDSLAFGARIMKAEHGSGDVTFSVRVPAHAMFLAVIPGKPPQIELVAASTMTVVGTRTSESATPGARTCRRLPRWRRRRSRIVSRWSVVSIASYAQTHHVRRRRAVKRGQRRPRDRIV